MEISCQADFRQAKLKPLPQYQQLHQYHQHPLQHQHQLQLEHQQHQHQHQHQHQYQQPLYNQQHQAQQPQAQQPQAQLHQQAQNQQHQIQQQYNMNSDYSSSTYHIYDQISDLIIIKQQRLERKRQKQHRRKVTLIVLGSILSMGALAFIALRLLFPPQASSSQLQQQEQILLDRFSQANAPLSHELAPDSPQLQPQPARPLWAPSLGPKTNDWFDASRFQSPISAGSIRLPGERPRLQQTVSQVIGADLSSTEPCNGHGLPMSQSGSAPCKCDAGFFGQRCELSATYQPHSNQLLARCLLANCHGNGQCNAQGKCLCLAGFYGPQCEFRLPQQQQVAAAAAAASDSQQQAQTPSQLGEQSARCSPGSSEGCAGNGQCTAQAKCKCYAGFAGPNCQERDLCFEQSCSEQGTCQPSTGACLCRPGFGGSSCEIRDDLLWPKLLNCSNHGKFDYNKRKCNCDRGFTGADCADEQCELPEGKRPLDCGPNGLFDCREAKCVCQDGFSGDQCQVQQCSAQCLRNGQCVDGNCLCLAGFYGKHCSLNGCPNQCSGRGQCVRTSAEPAGAAQGQQWAQQAEWRCLCQPGSTGDDCGLLVERQCDDGLDNDGDGLVDCADSECCGDRVCQNSTLCTKSPDPLDILMRKQPPPPTSSFFQRMQFLIDKFSSQIYTNLKDFNDSISVSRYEYRASVIRGRVTYLKQGITGVRVSVAGPIGLGVTFTRDGGYFDLMVNGGGAVVIEFRREPFATHQKAVRVPWNEIVLIDPVALTLDPANSDLLANLSSLSGQQQQQQAGEPSSPSCSAHNYQLMRPRIVSAPRSSRKSHSSSRSRGFLSQQTSRAIILRESATVQQSILLPGSSSRDLNSNEANQSVSLVYISSRANEFMSTISLQLTPPAEPNSGPQAKLPQELKLIHLKIVIEGNLFEQIFEPQTNLSFTYAWNRRNVYRQKSFGLSTASVSVGYEYYDCKHIIWTTKNVQLPGHDLSISDIGNQWNLNVHHRYNYRDSILQRGDGQNFNLKTDKVRVVQPVMGDGYQRQTACPFCDGATSPTEQRLLKPQALVSAADGSLYIGDFNLIRRIEWAPADKRAAPDRIVRTVLEMPPSRVPNKYSLALNLADQRLYMSDPDRHQVYLVRELGRQQQQQQQQQHAEGAFNETGSAASWSEEHLVAVVGSGVRCQPEDRANCGDGQAARLARLIEPRAVAFDLNNRMYIADGPNVRMVDTDNKIYTLLGDYGTTRHTKFPCSGEPIPMHKFAPKAPLDLAMNPLDDSLHILDDNVVYKITQDKRVQIVAGRPAHCLSQAGGEAAKSKPLKATEVFLQSAQSIVFNQNGELFVSEDDQRQLISRVLLVSPEEDTISLYAGLTVDQKSSSQTPTVDSIHVDSDSDVQDKQRSSNVLPMSQPTRALDYKFNSVAAIAVDQQGKLVVADKVQYRVLSVEADLPQVNAAGEYELQSPDNSDELLVFNRYGHHIATRELSAGQAQRSPNKYTFSYNVNTSLGQLASVGYSSGNKISIYRDGPHHSVKMIETAFGGQCKLDISRSGQVHSISIIAPNATKTSFAYHVDGGLLKQSRDQASGELFDFTYDEFGRAIEIQHSSPKFTAPIQCRVGTYSGQRCSALIVAE